jgi:hypothetical protein
LPFEGIQRGLRSIGARRRISRPSGRGEGLALLPIRKIETLAEQVHDTGLQRRRGKYRGEGLFPAFEAIGHRD